MSGLPIGPEIIADLVRDLGAASADPVDVVAPFSGEVLHRLAQHTPAEVAAARPRVLAAQREWAAAGPAHRKRVLLRAHDLLLERRELLLDAVQVETGKTRGQAFEEVFNSANAIRYAALAAPRVTRPHGRRGGIPLVLRARVDYVPKGVVGVITPWNYPLSLAAMDIAPALATGNGVIQKADDQGALSVLAARRAFVDAGLPPELWAVVCGPGAEVGSAVVDAADHVCFTGSTATGRIVAERAARRLVGASLELGGKNPLIVLDDVDVRQAAADAAYACFSAAGQLCVSMERIYVLRAVAEPFLEALAERTRSLVLGGAFDYSTDVGSLATSAQLERVRAHIDDAVAKGATLVAGGRPRPELGPLFLEPAVLTGVTEEMTCLREETFGAVVAVQVVDDEDAAIAACNDSAFGLNAAVLARSTSRARRVAARIEAGTVNINEGYRAAFASMDAPMGGVKASGLGRRNGREGLLRFVGPRTTATATGLLQLPRTGKEFRPLIGTMLLLLRTLRLVRRR